MSQAFADRLGWIAKSLGLEASLTRAQTYACEQGYGAVTVEHLLLALTEDRDAASVLAASRVDMNRLRREIAGFIGDQTNFREPGVHSSPVPSEELAKIFDYASAAAEQSGRPQIDGAIVLAALIGEGKSPAAELLKSHGLTFEQAVQTLQNRPPDVVAALSHPAESRIRPPPPAAPGNERSEAPHGQPIGEPGQSRSVPASSSPVRATLQPQLPLEQQRRDEATAALSPASVPSTAQQNPFEAGTSTGVTDDVLASVRALLEREKRGVPPAVRPRQQTHPITTSSDHGNVRNHEPALYRGPSETNSRPPPQPHRASTTTEPMHHSDANVSKPANQRPGSFAREQFPIPKTRSDAVRTGPRQAPTRPLTPHRPERQLGNALPAANPRQHAPMPRPPEQITRAPVPGRPPSRRAPATGGLEPGTQHHRMPSPSPLQARPDQAVGRAFESPKRNEQADTATAPSADTRANANLEHGLLVEDIPRTMKVGIIEAVEVRIARGDIEAMAGNLEGQGAPNQHDIFVTRAISVRLRSPEGGFCIESTSPETQWIEDNLGLLQDDFAGWRWTVVPRVRGPAFLQLVVSARTVAPDGMTAETALPDQFIEVNVRTNYKRRMKSASKWGAAMTLGGAFGAWGEEFSRALSRILGFG